VTHAAPTRRDAESLSLIREAARGYAGRHSSLDAIEQAEREPHGFSRAQWAGMVALGWTGALIDEAHGGLGLGAPEAAAVVEELAYAGIQSPLFAVAVEAATLLPGSRWLKAIAAGDLVVPALQETGPELEPKTRAAGNLLTGSKTLVPFASAATAAVVSARHQDGVGLYVVPLEHVTLTPLNTPSGRFFQLTLQDAEAEPAGEWSDDLLVPAAALKAVELLGIGRRALELTVGYVKQREQFGRPLARFQSVQRHCADMAIELEKVRVLAAQAISRPGRREAALAKIKASEAIPALLRTAHQLHGGIGYYRDYPLELLLRRSIVAQSECGSARWHRRALARDLAALRPRDPHGGQPC
jgi:alkylation response protein AidB-like acyl-CoA dehydrogenase